MAELKSKLPRFCVPRKRKGYTVVYFVVPIRLRPEGWTDKTPEVGRTNRHTLLEIIERGNQWNADLNRARLGKHEPLVIRKGSLAYLISRYKKTEHWLNLSIHTQKGYEPMLRVIYEWSESSGHPHIKNLRLPTIVKFLNTWKDKPRTRKNYKSVLSKIYQVAIEVGFVEENIIRRVALPKSHKIDRFFKAWTPELIEHFVQTADGLGLSNVGTAAIIAWESFRQTDVFDLQEPRDYRNGGFFFETSKTGELVSVLASSRTVNRLNQRPRTQLLLTVNDATGMKWTKNSFYHRFNEVRKNAGMDDYVFRKIRNSAAIHALKAGLTDAEFQQRFGWSKATVEEMKLRYSDLDKEIIDSGAEKLRAYDDKIQ